MSTANKKQGPTPTIREIDDAELDQVSGGFLPGLWGAAAEASAVAGWWASRNPAAAASTVESAIGRLGEDPIGAGSFWEQLGENDWIVE